ncbi:MAG: AmmeMemoRadiSam system radical SAM enzyme, partial [Nanoarchaeota archaeon]|nr:AmmeMemoRadiSam system radical SAM enzyme [Nanoarchaeota archaeon]
PLFHFLPGTHVLSIGTVGCNFACGFCQNWDISQASKKGVVHGQNLPPEKIVEYAKESNTPTIAYTYNEPAIFFEYAYDTARLAHKEGIKNVFVSNGYESKEAVDKIRPYLDGINIDLKAFSDDFYVRNCKARLQPVLDNIKRMHDLGVWVEVTTLVIPGENDSERELRQIAEFIAGVSKSIPWHVSRFHPDYKMQEKEATPAETLEKAYIVGKEAGLKYVYTGNIPNGREDTECPECGNMLIDRFHSNMKGLERDKCNKCKTKIEGVWE